jgi:hypothetical protein
MHTTSELGKFAELRAKTDRQLVALIHKAIETGETIARQASQGVNGNSELVKRQAKAEAACAQAAALLPTVYGLTELERKRLELKLREVRQMLERLRAGERPQVRTAGA